MKLSEEYGEQEGLMFRPEDLSRIQNGGGINFPSACAQMMDFRKGEVVEWELTPKGDLILKRNIRTKK